MKKTNIIVSILILLLIMLTGIIIHQKNIIKYEKLKFQNELLKVKDEMNNKIIFLKDEIRGKDIEIETYREYMNKNWHPIEVDVQACMKKRSYTTTGMSECVLESEEKWNNDIEKYLHELKNHTSTEAYEYLLKSQSEWEKYRDAQKKVIYNTIWNLQGTIYTNISHTEDVAITKRRAEWLFRLNDTLKNGNYVK